MPASSINLYHMQDTKNNFEAMRPAPVCTDTNILMGQCQNIHVSTNCYYGFHDPKSIKNYRDNADCEMVDVSHVPEIKALPMPLNNARKRSAEDSTYSQNKRLREEVQIKNKLDPETIEKKKLETSSEDLLECLYWNIHGGNFFQLLQCP
ncbi:uncharacterized protein LOC126768268 isoform X1 [Nymphalis io]|uniref:uncharacterized protein LOC126768268 isoform X1 n=1 Tax=Inachis io TaxID=171585 RepID=UPI002166C359|nr:uncharacterized protein LOC126768268 isoform X1 [Nymphalis io]